MLNFLSGALEFIGHLVVEAMATVAGAVLFALDTALNGWFAIFQLLLDGLEAVLPALPSVSTPPEFVEAINWFFPIVTLSGIAAGLGASYITFLAVKWLYKKWGTL